MTNEELLREAKMAREHSYAPYSHYRVGAALLTAGGQVYRGCNIENAAYSPTNCAERTAFFKAVYDGHRVFEKIAIVGGPEGREPEDTCAPCGVCRQVMMEFCDPDRFEVVLADGNGGILAMTLRQLLPHGFGPDNLK